jgi:hypothetical protein
LILGLVAGLVAGLLGPAEAAKKKKKKPPVVVAPVPVDVNYYLHRDACVDSDDATTLSTTDDADEAGDGCGSLEGGVITEIYATTGQQPPSNPVANSGPDTTTYETTDGVPFVLDATKEIRGSIAMDSFLQAQGGGISAGQAKMHAVITGTTAGASKVLGEATVEYLVTPNKGAYVLEFSIKPDAAFDKASFTTLEITITNRGLSYLHTFLSVDDPSSWITVGTLK